MFLKITFFDFLIIWLIVTIIAMIVIGLVARNDFFKIFRNIIKYKTKDDRQLEIDSMLERLEFEKIKEIQFLQQLEIYEHTEKSVNMGGWIWDLTTNPDTVRYTKNFANIFDLPEQGSTTAAELMKVVHVDDRMHLNQKFINAMDKGESYEIEYRIVRRNDRNDLIKAMGVPVLNENNKMIKLKGVIILIKTDVD
jgi:PAS domain-containing protein